LACITSWETPVRAYAKRTEDEAREAMGVDRDLSWDELKEGFPPAYTEHLGRQAAAYIGAGRK
jgi:hypothetical protein